EHILTSIVKRLDVAVFEAVDKYLTTGDVGEVAISIEIGGIDYVTPAGWSTTSCPCWKPPKKTSGMGPSG
ncbi:MAG TPA: hypothetical protein VFY54_19610, partial [Rubrobacter sp.]|nr:hypothetical protein [Rubrobacter sp.]